MSEQKMTGYPSIDRNYLNTIIHIHEGFEGSNEDIGQNKADKKSIKADKT